MKNFVRHYLEMLVAMVVGMVVLGPVWRWVLGLFGAASVLDGTEVMTLVMATNMTIAMSGWMALRGHGWRPIAEMGAAMYVAFLVLFPLLWLGMLTRSGVMIVGHVLMLVTMLLAMLWRREEYSCAGHHKVAAES